MVPESSSICRYLPPLLWYQNRVAFVGIHHHYYGTRIEQHRESTQLYSGCMLNESLMLDMFSDAMFVNTFDDQWSTYSSG
jgi:hypothetical protein